MQTIKEKRVLNIEEIQKTIPHRYPFLLVDRVEILEEAKRAVGIKNVSVNEEFFNGHFPGKPILPGVLIIEAIAQTACVLYLSRPELKDKLAYLTGVDKGKFRKPVIPGDQLRLEVEVLRDRSNFGKVKGTAYVEKELVAEAEISFAIVDR